MPIKIVDGAQAEIRNLVATIHSPPGVGKTSLGFTARTPLLLDFDGNVAKAANRRGKALVEVTDWQDIDGITSADLAPYDTVVVDTVGASLECIIVDMIRKNPKMGRGGGQPSMQGWGELKTRFGAFLSLLLKSNVDVVLIAHGSEESRGDETVDRIMAVGSSRQLVYQKSHIMGRLSAEADRRQLTFNPTDTVTAKNVGAGIPDAEVPLPEIAPDFLAGIIDEAKRLIRESGQADVNESDRMTALRAEFDGLDADADAFNARAAAMKAEGLGMKEAKLLMQVADSKGLTFNREARKFEGGTTQPEPQPETEPEGEKTPEPEQPDVEAQDAKAAAEAAEAAQMPI